MPDETEATTVSDTALAVREVRSLEMPLPMMSDGELAVAFRTAKALAESGLFKDATKAGQAFAKILAGRDLGLTPFESMSALHVIEGKVEAGSDLHATRVRSREGYDFEVWWIKQDGDKREAVRAADESPTDLRETVGCAIQFTVNGESRGVSRWTVEDSETAGLMRDKGNHKRYFRNMSFARAMTNGVAWYVPEVMGGVRVYGLGEIPRHEDITDVEGSAESVDVVLPIAVEAIVARARELGHAGLSNRSAVVMAVEGQPEAFVEAWCRDATRTLNRMAVGKPEVEYPGVSHYPLPAQQPDDPAIEPFVVKVTAEIAEAMGEHGQSTLDV